MAGDHRSSPDAGRQLALRWRSARQWLAEQGVDGKDLDELQDAVRSADSAGDQSQLLVSAGGEVLLVTS